VCVSVKWTFFCGIHDEDNQKANTDEMAEFFNAILNHSEMAFCKLVTIFFEIPDVSELPGGNGEAHKLDTTIHEEPVHKHYASLHSLSNGGEAHQAVCTIHKHQMTSHFATNEKRLVCGTCIVKMSKKGYAVFEEIPVASERVFRGLREVENLFHDCKSIFAC
jgi:hypothetical protein